MRLANNIKVSVFVKTTNKFVESINQDLQKTENDEAAVKKHLLSLFPFDLEEEKIALLRNKTVGFNQREIIILEVELHKERHTNAFLEFLKSKFNEQQKSVILSQENRLDDDCNLFIRLDKAKLLKNEFWIIDTGDCFHIRICIAAFPKKKEKAKEIVEKIFS